jgi:hypothetical protein
MPEFIEGHQRFSFDEQLWKVENYDKHPFYLKQIAGRAETKAVDFVGLQGGESGILFWIEIKDFRGYRVPQKQLHPTESLAGEIAQKVRDSVAGILGAHHTSGNAEVWLPFVKAMWEKNTMKVLLWLEEDLPRSPRGRRENQASVQADKIKRNLRWLTSKVFVVSGKAGGCPEGLVVTDLPGAGQL